MQEQTKQAAARGDAAVTPLADLEFIPFLDKDGKLTTVDTKGVKASVYAVYDEVREDFMHYFCCPYGVYIDCCMCIFDAVVPSRANCSQSAKRSSFVGLLGG